MKKIIPAMLIIFMLTSCSTNSAEQRFLDIRSEYLAGDVSLSADITADYGDKSYEYGVIYCGDGKSGEISIHYPDEISGISASISETGKVSLKCGDALLETGLIQGTGISPLESVPLIVNAVREGYVIAIYTETVYSEKYIAAEIDATPAGNDIKTIFTLWFSYDDSRLRKAEISADGYAAVTVVFEEVQ